MYVPPRIYDFDRTISVPEERTNQRIRITRPRRRGTETGRSRVEQFRQMRTDEMPSTRVDGGSAHDFGLRTQFQRATSVDETFDVSV
jgi:hypothetical protein